MIQNWVYKDFTIQSYDKVESTNSLIFELAKIGSVNHNHIIESRIQTIGKGRYGRKWQSYPDNLYFSLLLKPNKDIAFSSLLSFVGVAAMGLAIEELVEKPATINYKWPNDILINGKKIAGLLLESDYSQNKTNFVIIGIGVNITASPDDTPYPASNLKNELECDINPKVLLKTFLNKFSDLYKNWLDFGFKATRNLWLTKAFNLNKEIIVNLSNEQIKGKFKDLDDNGNLVLELENNKIRLISSGEVFDS